MKLKIEYKVLEEIRKINKEIKKIKLYLEKLIELNLKEIKTVKPTAYEEKIIKEPIRKKDYLDWEKIKDEL